MLLALNVFELQHIALIDNGKHLVFLIVLGLLIQHGEAVELDGKACCLEAAAFASISTETVSSRAFAIWLAINLSQMSL